MLKHILKMFSGNNGAKPPLDAYEFKFNIVGESYYQSNLYSICGGKTRDGVEHFCRAMLQHEPENPVDENAIAVFIDRKKVGYISKNRTKRTHKQLKNGTLVVDAVIVGGWKDEHDEGDFGVRLDLQM